MEIASRIRQRLLCLSITYRIAIGNTIIIAIGAVGGTLLTRQLASRAADLWLILLFLFIGTTLSVLTNFAIVKSALRPLRQLGQLVVRVQAGQSEIDPQFLRDTDPDISQLASAIDSLVNELEERNLQLRALSERAINAQEEERKRIALSLHDDTGQALSMLIIHLEQLQDRLPPEMSDLCVRLDAAHQLATRTLRELRKIVSGLRPTILDDLGLIPAIRWYARSNLEEAGVRVELNASEENMLLPPQLNSTLFRIAQEAINNILRHAQANSVTIALHQNKKEVCLSIADDGQGFDLIAAQEQAVGLQHLGLLGIQERAEMVGGRVTVSSAPGKGTQLQVSVPLPA
ncbi:MAG TPA: sensor histidine kinase [Anaerolineales bacterium]|nr:sensor histidine kinase [Anaerolineales bacterium]